MSVNVLTKPLCASLSLHTEWSRQKSMKSKQQPWTTNIKKNKKRSRKKDITRTTAVILTDWVSLICDPGLLIYLVLYETMWNFHRNPKTENQKYSMTELPESRLTHFYIKFHLSQGNKRYQQHKTFSFSQRQPLWSFVDCCLAQIHHTVWIQHSNKAPDQRV